jgi:hypothetical protein
VLSQQNNDHKKILQQTDKIEKSTVNYSSIPNKEVADFGYKSIKLDSIQKHGEKHK